MSLGTGGDVSPVVTPPSAPAVTPPTTPAVNAPAPSLGTGNQPTTSWRDSLPDDLKADPTLSKYSDVANLSKAHIELQKKFGQKGVFKPGKDASPEEVKAFREQMGIPTSPDKYDLGDFGDVKVDPSIVDWAKKIGSEHGVEPAALKAIIADYVKTESANEKAMETALKAAVQEGFDGLRTEWGEAFQRNIDRANFAVQKTGGQALVDRLKEFGADNDPLILKHFAEVAKLYGEDQLREAGAGDGAQSPLELDAEIKQVQARMFAMKPTDGAYASTKLKYESLWKQKTRGK